MPETVVVSVLQEEESVLPPLFPQCCPLPCAALQVVSENSSGWKALLCFIFARLTFTCDHYLMGFPVAFCGSVSCKRAQKVLPQSLPPAVLAPEPRVAAWLACGTASPCSSQAAPRRPAPVLVRLWSRPCGVFLLLPWTFCPQSSFFWPAVGVGGCMVILMPRLTLCFLIYCSAGGAGEEPSQICCSAHCWWDRQAG